MMFIIDTWAELGKFMDSGGMVLWAIVILLFVMWTLLFERMWYLRSNVDLDVKIALNEWNLELRENQSGRDRSVKNLFLKSASK